MTLMGQKREAIFSKESFRSFLKRSGYRFKRMRFVPPKKPDESLYNFKKGKIAQYQKLAAQGKIDLLFFDESGFATNTSLPYAWSLRNHTRSIAASYARRFNVLGFLDIRNNRLVSCMQESTVATVHVIAAFDALCEQLQKPAVVVLDNASFHTSKAFRSQIPQWANRGLTLCYLPPYSPQLNPIEILWKHIKYLWSDLAAFQSHSALKSYVNHVLENFGTLFNIDFSGTQNTPVKPLILIPKL